MAQATELLQVEVVGGRGWLTAAEVCRLCRLEPGMLAELAELGAIAPRGAAPEGWELPAEELPRLRVAGRLIHDLGVNLSGVALALELLAARHRLECRLDRLERLIQELED